MTARPAMMTAQPPSGLHSSAKLNGLHSHEETNGLLSNAETNGLHHSRSPSPIKVPRGHSSSREEEAPVAMKDDASNAQTTAGSDAEQPRPPVPTGGVAAEHGHTRTCTYWCSSDLFFLCHMSCSKDVMQMCAQCAARSLLGNGCAANRAPDNRMYVAIYQGICQAGHQREP